MNSTAEYYDRALDSVKQNRSQQEISATARLNLLYTTHPELQRLDYEIKGLFSGATKKMLSGERMDFSDITAKSLELQRRRGEYLKSHGIDERSLQPQYNCPVCSDSGYNNGKMCECVRRLAAQMMYDELNRSVPLEQCTFECFSTQKYPEARNKQGVSPREIMTKIRNYCVEYAQSFSPRSPSLLFFGKTGLGKTHLSLSIANEVIRAGYGVIYGPISHILQSIESEYFSKGGNSSEHTKRNVINCDLLILDDLGTEFTTPFITSTIYDIVNSRLLSGKPIIINTNLDFAELEKKYTPRLVSRISGCYKMFEFFGEDIRTLI